MLEYLITGLLIVLVPAALFQPNAPRFFATMSCVLIILLHEVWLSDTTGILYYGSAALFDLAIILVTSGIQPVPKLVLRLHAICGVSIIVNLFGWVIWYLYYPPLVYDAAFMIIYAWALIAFIKRDGCDVGRYRLSSWSTCFRFHWGASLRNYFRSQG